MTEYPSLPFKSRIITQDGVQASVVVLGVVDVKGVLGAHRTTRLVGALLRDFEAGLGLRGRTRSQRKTEDHEKRDEIGDE